MDKTKLISFAVLIGCIVIILIAPFFGALPLSVDSFLTGFSAVESSVFYDIRIPRVILGFSVGMILSLAGVLYQTVFKNSLADPYTLGVSSGASLGASFYVLFLQKIYFLHGGVTYFSLLGALCSIILVVGLSQLIRRHKAEEVLLCGIVVSFFFSSLILLFQYIADASGVVVLSRWFMGGLGDVDQGSAVLALICAGLFFCFAQYVSGSLDLTLLGDEIAASRGVQVSRLQRQVLTVVSCVVGISVAIAGPIGFVGIMVPHIVRGLFGARHRVLLSGVALIGGAFLVGADIFARSVIRPAELPVGVVTSLLGGPFFVWVMLSKKRAM